MVVIAIITYFRKSSKIRAMLESADDDATQYGCSASSPLNSSRPLMNSVASDGGPSTSSDSDDSEVSVDDIEEARGDMGCDAVPDGRPTAASRLRLMLATEQRRGARRAAETSNQTQGAFTP